MYMLRHACTIQISCNVAPAPTRGFTRGLIIAQNKGAAPVLLADITKHTQGCTLTSKTGATPPWQLLSLKQTHERERMRDLYHTWICNR